MPQPRYVDMSESAKLEAQERLLEAYLEYGSIERAARATGIPSGLHGHSLAHDPSYPARWRATRERLADLMEGEAWRRAVQGVPRPIFQMGEEVGETIEYSDRLLELLLKGALPDRYRERVSVINESAIDAEIQRLQAELVRLGLDPEQTTPLRVPELSAGQTYEAVVKLPPNEEDTRG